MPSAKKKSDKVEVKSAKADGAPKPDWPAFNPLPFPEDLVLEDVVPGQITTARLWTSALCKKYVSFLKTLPLVTTPGKPKKGEAVRVNDRYQIDDPAFAERLWSETGLCDLVMSYGVDETGEGDKASERMLKQWGGMPVGLSPNIRIYRYSPGQFFDKHYDDANSIVHPGPPATPAKTTWTLLLYLTSPAEGCLGGETVFYPEPSTSKKAKGSAPPEPVVTNLVTGMVLLHKHGQDCMLHEGREVTQGEKWVIRSDLCVER